MNKEIEELLNDIKKQLTIEERLGKEIAKDFHTTTLNYKEIKILLSYIEQLETDYEEAIESVTWWRNRFNAVKRDKKQLENNRDKAIEVINTQLKNAEGGLKDNLRIIKFNLIKGSCTFEDLKTEEDYKYILKGDSDE